MRLKFQIGYQTAFIPSENAAIFIERLNDLLKSVEAEQQKGFGDSKKMVPFVPFALQMTTEQKDDE